MPNRYSGVHSSAKGPGDARPTAQQIVQDENLVGQLQGKVLLITGGSSGIGSPTVRAMASTGVTCFVTVRDMGKGQKALSNLLEPGQVELIHLDNTSLDSVRAGATEFLKKSGGKCNMLICNAGIMAVPQLEKTKDGFESQFGTNHVAHFLLFDLLKDAMMKSSTPEFNSRVITVSSAAHRRSGIRPNHDYAFSEEGTYDPWAAYGQSKTANIYMDNYIDREYGWRGIHALSIHPGNIFTGLQVYVSPKMKGLWDTPEARLSFKSVEQGAATQVYAAISKEWEGQGGRYLEDCGESFPYSGQRVIGVPGYATHAYNKTEEDKLWKHSLMMVRIKC